jgi:hypothetical protein
MSSERDRSSGVEVGDLLGASGQAIRDWVRDRQIAEYRVSGRIVVPRGTVAAYVGRARSSLDLEDIPPDEAARLVAEGRRGAPPRSPGR